MEFKAALLRRRSIRRYTDEPVSREELRELLTAAMHAPSACNMRPWAFYAITDREILKALRGAARYTNLGAPAAIVVCGDLSRALPGDRAAFWVQDCSAATENILLAAADMGLGTVWCGIHPKDEAVENVRNALGLGEELIPLNVIYVGHPAEAPDCRGGYDEERVHFIG